MSKNHKHKKNSPLDYSYIDLGIYIGTNQCCALGLAEVLQKEKISADISLEEIRLDQPFGVDIYAWIPTPDHTAPKPSQLIFGVKALDELIKQKRKIYVHCKNGHGRASTLVSAYFIYKGMTVKESVNKIKSGRPTIHLQDEQFKSLEIFFKSLK